MKFSFAFLGVLLLAALSFALLVNFTDPTPANGTAIYYQHAVINVTVSENVSSCTLRTNASLNWSGLWSNVRHLGIYGGRFDYNASIGVSNYSSFTMMYRLPMAAGSNHICYLLNSGNSECYGNNNQGQSENYSGGDAISMSASETYNCYLQANGSAVCLGTYFNPSWSVIPMPNYTGTDAVAMAAGYFHTCYLLSSGNSACYGDNTDGQSINYTGGDAIGLAASDAYDHPAHTCYLLSSGNSACYGDSDCDGNTPCVGSEGESTNYTGGDAIAISAGALHTCYLLSNGNSACYGYNNQGQSTNYTGGDAIAVSAAGPRTCYLFSNGSAACYGDNSYSQSDPYTGGDAIAVSAGAWHTCCLRSNGTSACYGLNVDNRATNYTGGDLKIPFASADSSLAMEVHNADGLTTANYTLPALPDGNYAIYANCTSPANASNVSETRVFTLSMLAAPLLVNFTDPTPANGSAIDYQGAVINVTVSKNVSSCTLDINGNESSMEVHNADGLTTANYTLPALPDGNYTIYANCTDSNNSNVSETRQFTLAMPVFLLITNVSVSYSGDNATITWHTNQDANSTLNYSTTTELGNYSVNSTQTQSHIITLAGLPEAVQYYYNVTSCTSGGLCNTTGPYGFSIPSSLVLVNFTDPTPANGSALASPNVTINVTANQNLSQCLLSLYTPAVLWTNVGHLGIYGGMFDYNASMGVNNYSSFNVLNLPPASGAAYDTCYLLSNGNSICKGTNDYGQSVNYTGGDAIAVAAGQIHTCYLLRNGTSVCYGSNDYGQSVNYTGGDAIAVSTHYFHTCYLLTNGNSACYGLNPHGQTTNYTGGDAIAVATGYAHTCYLLSNGNSACYGSSLDGAVNYTGGNAIGLAAGMAYTCYLLSNSTPVCYGNNQFGQSVPYTGSDTVAIYAGEAHTCYLRSNGNSVCHGHSDYGETASYLGNDAIGIAAGFYHTCYLLRNGTSVCYGHNNSGQSTGYSDGDLRLQFQSPVYPMTVHNASNATTADYLPPLMFNGDYTIYANCTSPANASNVSETRTFSLTLFQPDDYEPDDSIAQANWIDINGTMQRHNFHSLSDFDYVKFNATAGYTYVIQAVTRNSSGVIDTEMYLFDASGTALAYSDDISPGNVSSRIMFRPAYNATYYVEVNELHGKPGGFYDLRAQRQGILVASIVNVTATGVLLNGSFNITTTVTCTGGPCGNVTANLDPAPAAASRPGEPKASLSELAENGSIPVIVKLKNVSAPETGRKGGKSAVQKMAESQAAVISTLSAGEFTPGYRYTVINGFSGRVSKAGLEKLLADPAVESVSYDREKHIALDLSVPFIGAPAVWNLTVNGIYMNGSGQTVCILDTGINYSHPDFGGYGTFPNAKVLGGYDYVNNDSDPMDDNGHGSHVSGIVASMDSIYRGVAPGANIVMVKVCDSSGACHDSDMLAGIQWCIDNASAFNISAISMSIGGEAYEDGWDCDLGEAAMAAAINSAVASNLTFVVSSGNGIHNDGHGLGYMNPGGLSSPACVKNAISVGAVDSLDGIAYFGNRNNQLDLLAPGWSITSTSYNTGGHSSLMGTSMSAPHVSGLAILMNQYYLAEYNRRPTPHELELVMEHQGRPDLDYAGRNPLTYPRIDSLPSVLDIGILSTDSSARPFYTTVPNPAADSCLVNMGNGTSCNSTWTVVATGDSGNYNFFTIYETAYDTFYTDNKSITILANLTSCSVINQSGSYQLAANLTGSPISSNEVQTGTTSCIKIAASDVMLDCDGFSITNDGPQTSRFGIVVNGSRTNVTVRNCNIQLYARGIYTSYTPMAITNVSVSGNSVGFYIISNDTNVSGSNTTGNNNFGFYLMGAWRTNLTGNEVAGNPRCGISVMGGGNTTLAHNTVHGNVNGTCIYSSAVLSGERYYANGKDLVVQNGTYDVAVAAGTVFDSPAGDYQNFTNISLNDSVESGVIYALNWSAPPASPPSGYSSFAGKFLQFTNLSGSVSLDKAVWSWTDAEVAAGGYNESDFSLWAYNSSGWTLLNSSPDTVSNTLSLSALTASGILGILQLNDTFPPDAYEPDNSMANATWIETNGTVQEHNFHVSGDIDYVKFNGTAGYTYIIQTVNRSIPALLDTEMYLYNLSGTLLAYSDDIVLYENVSSHILFRAAQNGTYYVRVDELYGEANGSYGLFVQQQGVLTASILNVTSTILRLNDSFNVTTTVTCTGGPCGNVTANLDPQKKQPAGEFNGAGGTMPVIVKLKDIPASYARDGQLKGGKTLAQAMAESQNSVLSTLSAEEFSPGYRYSIINGFSGKVTKEGLQKLLATPAVESVTYDRERHINLDVSVPLINATAVWNINVSNLSMNGSGQTVCIIDTGINYNHPDFGGYGTFPNAKVIGGYDFVNSDADPMDDNGHGSHVAGIVASMDATYRGVAPGAKIVMIKVCTAGGSCSDSNMIAGLQWCTNNASAFNISAISMSIGGGAYVDGWNCDLDEPAMTAAINAAVASNISVIISSGNGIDNDGNGLGYANPGGLASPACIKNALSVGATSDSDLFATFTNRNNQLDLLAPGVDIMATRYDTTGHTTQSGTSMAAPHVSGLVALMSQYYLDKYNRTATPHELELAMKREGKALIDSTGRNPLTYPRIDALVAVLDKGIISTNHSAKPFYTLSANPAADSCLVNMGNGTSCNSTWTVVATGDSGNYNFFTIYETAYDVFYTDNRSILLDVTGPAVLLNAPGNNSALNASDVIFNFTATDDLSAAMNCFLYIDGAANQTNASVANATPTAMPVSGMAEGNHSWFVSCNDSVNNAGSSETRALSIDLWPPNITNISNISILEGNALAVQFNATDASGIANWSVNDSRFAINASGFLSNATQLPLGLYYLDISAADPYGKTASAAIWVNVTPHPVIHAAYALPAMAFNGTAIDLYINASNTSGVWAEILLPDATRTNVTLANCSNTSFNETAGAGTYNVTFHANGSLGSMANQSASFTTFELVTFTMNVSDYNGSGVNSSIAAYVNGTEFASNTSANGTFATPFPGTLVDLNISAYSGNFLARLNGFNATLESGKIFGVDQIPAGTTSGLTHIGAYGTSTNYSFSNLTLYLRYGGFTFSYEPALLLWKCTDWNFTNRTCAGNWTNITAGAVQNLTEHSFTYANASFSAFAFVQGPWCGDGSCKAGETCASCASDCGVCPGGGTGGSSGGSSGGGGGGGGAGGGSARASRNITLFHASAAETECSADSGCPAYAACLGGVCRNLTGICGHAASHTWAYYACCQDSECATGFGCSNYTCKEIPQPYVPPKQPPPANGTEVPAAPAGGLPSQWPALAAITALAGLAAGLLSARQPGGGIPRIRPAAPPLPAFPSLEPAAPGAPPKYVPRKHRRSHGHRLKAIAVALPLLFLVSIALSADNVTYYEQKLDYPHQLFSSSFAASRENLTTYRFRILNELDTQTTSFRLRLSSDFDWFNPSDLHYPFMPDGIDNASPYWDIPPIAPNESTEISFSVDRVVGLPTSIVVNASPLAKWSGDCSHLVPYNASGDAVSAVAGFLNRTNRTQEVTGYYESGDPAANRTLLLAYLHGYGTFAVFTINGSGVAPVADTTAVSWLASEYASAATSPSDANLSMLHLALLGTKELKARPERECYMLTGMDDNPCVDRDTCIYACFSVPVCSLVGQSGWSFLDQLQDYNRSVYQANKLLDASLVSSKVASTQPSYSSVRKALDDLIDLNRAESKVIFHPIIISYGFCEPPDYGIPGQTEARRQLLDYLDAACVQGEQDRLVAEALHVAPLLGAPAQANVRNATNASRAAANASVSPAARNLTNQGGQPAAAVPTQDWASLAAVLAVLFAVGFLGGRFICQRLRRRSLP